LGLFLVGEGVNECAALAKLIRSGQGRGAELGGIGGGNLQMAVVKRGRGKSFKGVWQTNTSNLRGRKGEVIVSKPVLA